MIVVIKTVWSLEMDAMVSRAEDCGVVCLVVLASQGGPSMKVVGLISDFDSDAGKEFSGSDKDGLPLIVDIQVRKSKKKQALF